MTLVYEYYYFLPVMYKHLLPTGSIDEVAVKLLFYVYGSINLRLNAVKSSLYSLTIYCACFTHNFGHSRAS